MLKKVGKTVKGNEEKWKNMIRERRKMRNVRGEKGLTKAEDFFFLLGSH